MNRMQEKNRNIRVGNISFEKLKHFNIYERPQQIKISFLKQLRAELIQEMFAINLPDCSPNIKIKVIQNLNFLSWFLWVRNCVSRIEEHGLMVFGNKMLRKVFGPQVRGEWRRLHNEELNDLYSSPNILGVTKSVRMRWDGHVSVMREWKCAYRVKVGKPEGKRPV
jgi:hypothetical protein